AKLKPSFINNDGAQMCFQEPDPNNVFFPSNSEYTIKLKRCTDYTGALPDNVMFYMEREVSGNHLSELITTSSTPDDDSFPVNIGTTPFAVGTRLVVKAKSTSGGGVTAITTTATLLGVVADNRPPTAINLNCGAGAGAGPGVCSVLE